MSVISEGSINSSSVPKRLFTYSSFDIGTFFTA
nr:MAG TPA: hypothetical protein [Caudoviricetes sp.]